MRIDARAWPLPPVFGWLRDHGALSVDDLARTLNCGIGMVVVVAPELADKVAASLRAHGETVFTIGAITAWAGAEVVIDGREEAWKG